MKKTSKQNSKRSKAKRAGRKTNVEAKTIPSDIFDDVSESKVTKAKGPAEPVPITILISDYEKFSEGIEALITKKNRKQAEKLIKNLKIIELENWSALMKSKFDRSNEVLAKIEKHKKEIPQDMKVRIAISLTVGRMVTFVNSNKSAKRGAFLMETSERLRSGLEDFEIKENMILKIIGCIALKFGFFPKLDDESSLKELRDAVVNYLPKG